MGDIYGKRIIEIYRNPPNEGTLEDAETFSAENPKCGDRTKIYIKKSGGEIEEVRHETKGCAISTAAVSLLSEKIERMESQEVRELDREDVLELLEAEIPDRRVKCVELGLEALGDL